MSEMMSNFFHPTIGFLVLIGALPFLPGKWWKWVLPIPAIIAVISVVQMTPGNYGGLEWMGFQLQLARVDRLSIIFAHVFAIQAVIGFIYAMHVKRKIHHVAAAMYVGGAFGCVFAGDYLTLFLFWELMSVASTVLIWLNHRENKKAPGAGLRYFLIHTLGGLLMLGGMLLRYKALGNWDFVAIDPATAQVYDWLILFGFGVNAAFIGLHAWLPDAYPEATIPGAVFMSAFTTKTAVYTLARAFAGWEFLAIMGVLMALYGVVYATMENNARRILSYHIVSQVGYMVAGIGIGTYMTVNGAAAHAYAHILYKGLLFMSVGALLHATGTAKLTELGGLVGRLPWVMICYVVAGLSISGWPVFNGFVSKTMTIAGAFADHRVLLGLGMEVAAVGTFLSVGLKLPYFAFWGGKPNDMQRKLTPIPWNMYVAMFIGAGLCIAQGVYPQMLYTLLPYPEAAAEFHPWTPWHVTQALLLLSFAGLAFYLQRETMKPHRQLNLDFEFFYRWAGKLFLWVVSYPLAWLDSIWTEVYRWVGLRGLLWSALGTDVFDRRAIDGVVDGAAYNTREAGRGTALAQTGRLNDYFAGAVVVGLIVFVVVWLVG